MTIKGDLFHGHLCENEKPSPKELFFYKKKENDEKKNM